MTAYGRKYQILVAAKHQDVARWREEDLDCQEVMVTSDGIQPEKGHEAVYVGRERRKHRIGFTKSLLSSPDAEIRQMIQRRSVESYRLNFANTSLNLRPLLMQSAPI